MEGRGETGRTRAIVYCVVPRELADKLHDVLRQHFRDDPGFEVIVEHRARDRRAREDRRAEREAEERAERRRIRSTSGRRVSERRAALVPVDGPELPRRVRALAAQLTFYERLEPSSQHAEDVDTARLVMRIQSGDQAAFSDLYMRYFDRVYGYLRIALKDIHEAEDVTQQVFLEVLEGISRYERRQQPFRAWLFVVVRNHALTRLRKLGRFDVDTEAVERQRDSQPDPNEEAAVTLDWISDRELLLFIERLPLAQRQVLVLRYMLGLSTTEIATTLDRSADSVRQQQARALGFLRQRLSAVGRAPRHSRRSGARLLVPQARVLRARRYSLLSRGATS